MRTTALIAAAGLMMSAMASAETIRIGTEGAYAPWNYLDDSGEVAGFEIALGNELCKRAALECEWIVNEWDSIIPNLLAGNYDAIMAGMSITDERKESIDFSSDYFPPDPSKFAANAGREFDFDSLNGSTIGVQGSTIQAAYAEENFGANNTIKSYGTFDQSVADLVAGNIELLLADGQSLDPIVESTDGQIVYVGPDVVIGGGVAIGLRKDDSELKTKLESALSDAKKDGTVDKLIQEYFEAGPFYSN